MVGYTGVSTGQIAASICLMCALALTAVLGSLLLISFLARAARRNRSPDDPNYPRSPSP